MHACNQTRSIHVYLVHARKHTNIRTNTNTDTQHTQKRNTPTPAYAHTGISAYTLTRILAHMHDMHVLVHPVEWNNKEGLSLFFFFFTYIRHTWSGKNTDPVASHMYGLNGAYLETIVLTWSAVVALINLQPSSFRSVDHSCRIVCSSSKVYPSGFF